MVARRKIDNLTLKQEAMVIALLREPSIGRAAASVGVAERTVYHWLDEPDFADAYRKARRQAFSQAIALTQRYAALAVQRLAQVMTDATAPHHAKVTAAAALLKFGREGIELDDLAARLDALEQAQQAKAPTELAA